MVGFLSKIKEKVEETSGLLWKEADPEDLKPGDHIYVHMALGSYTHHGIYVGERSVIHYTQTGIPRASPAPCPVCGYEKCRDRGVVRTCLNCSRREDEKLHSARRFAYGVPEWTFLLRKSGTCTMAESSRTADEALGAAYELLRKGFGEYSLWTNNCEHFATFCCTGQKQCVQTPFYNGVEGSVKKMWFYNDVADLFKKMSS